jgi:hypothetical protein
MNNPIDSIQTTSITIYITAKCESCNFKRYNVSIRNNHFSNYDGYQTLQHLVKHQDHIMTLANQRYKISEWLHSIVKID